MTADATDLAAQIALLELQMENQRAVIAAQKQRDRAIDQHRAEREELARQAADAKAAWDEMVAGEMEHRGRVLTDAERTETVATWVNLREVWPNVKIENVGPDRVVGPWGDFATTGHDQSSADSLSAAQKDYLRREKATMALWRKAQAERAAKNARLAALGAGTATGSEAAGGQPSEA